MAFFKHSTVMPVEVGELFNWHAREGAFDRLRPPWQRVDVLRSDGSLQDGAEVNLALRNGPFSLKWHLRHQDYQHGKQFRDVQIKGPFAHWDHLHRFESLADDSSLLSDEIHYKVPFSLPLKSIINNQLRGLFRFRHQRTLQDLQLHQKYYKGDPLRILISGSSGMVGNQLIHFLQTGGHEVIRLLRRSEPSKNDAIQWNPDRKQLVDGQLENFDIIIHLGGVNLASWPWTKSRKKEILESRVNSTNLLAEALGRIKNPPRLFICASAVGIYGDREDQVLTEASEPGRGFLADVVKQWESACDPARIAGIRVANLRFGIILDPGGGALKKLILPFKSALGTVIGEGNQYMPWIAIDDVLGAIYHTIFNDHLQGPVNLVAPNVMTNLDFSHILGQVLNRPVMIRTPAWILKKVLGEMAEETLLVSTRAKPEKLVESGYSFLFPELEPALRFQLGRIRPVQDDLIKENINAESG